jgi:hypothetical protein
MFVLVWLHSLFFFLCMLPACLCLCKHCTLLLNACYCNRAMCIA